MRRRMSSEEVRTVFENAGCIVRDGHFVYASGRHGDTYLNKDIVLSDPRRAQRFGESIAIGIEDTPFDRPIEVVVGAANSGIGMSHVTANHLWTPSQPVISIYADRGDRERGEDPKQFYLRRGFDQVVRGRAVAISEDIFNQGTNTLRLIQLIEAAGGEVMVVGVIWNRGSLRVIARPGRASIPICALREEELPAVLKHDCLQCAHGIPINALGHGSQFLMKRDPV